MLTTDDEQQPSIDPGLPGSAEGKDAQAAAAALSTALTPCGNCIMTATGPRMGPRVASPGPGLAVAVAVDRDHRHRGGGAPTMRAMGANWQTWTDGDRRAGRPWPVPLRSSDPPQVPGGSNRACSAKYAGGRADSLVGCGGRVTFPPGKRWAQVDRGRMNTCHWWPSNPSTRACRRGHGHVRRLMSLTGRASLWGRPG